MARLPTVGGDNGNWGTILNEYLQTQHNADGTHDPGVDTTAVHDNVAGEIAAVSEKTTPVAGDYLLIEDGQDGLSKKKVDIDNLPTQDLSGYVTKASFDANSILAATTDNTPVALTISEATVMGRQIGGNIAAIAQISAGEKTSGTETAIRAFAPADVKNMVETHGGDVSGPSTATDNAIARLDGEGGKTIQNSGITIDDNDNMTGNLGSLSGFKGAINPQTGTSYTTQDSDHGKIITLSNASGITLTIHQAAPAGFNCLIIQLGAGQVTVAAGGTGNVRNYDSHTKLAGQYAADSILVVSNAGTAPEVYLAGNTGGA